MQTKNEIFEAIQNNKAKLLGTFRPEKGALQVDKWKIKNETFIVTSFTDKWNPKNEKPKYTKDERVEKIIELN